MSDNTFKEMLKEYKKVVQIPFEEYKEQTKKDKKEVFQFMVHKMANDDIKLYESLEKNKEYIELLEEVIERLKEEYMILQNASDEVEEEKDKEIEKLNTIIEIKTNRIQDLMSRLSKRQDRIDKAIEYIEEHKRTYENDEYCFDDMIDEVTPLLDILKGSDKE